MEDIEDPTNLTGISKLLNKDHVNEKIDLESLEKDMIGGGGLRKIKVNDPTKEFHSKMQEINRVSGMEVLDGGYARKSKENHRPQAKYPVSSSSGSYSGSSSSGSYGSSGSYSGSSSSGSYSDDDGDDDGDGDDDILSKIKSSDKHMQPVSNVYRPVSKPKTHVPGYRTHGHSAPAPAPAPAPFYTQRSAPAPYAPPYAPAGGVQMAAPGYGQPPGYGGDSLDQAMHAYAGTNTNFAIESIEDEEEKKSELIEDIDELKWELEDDEVDISRIPEVNQDSTIEEIMSVRKILRRKYDRRRFNSFGTEFILAFAQVIEYICDGNRKVGKFTVPDLTNWHNTVRAKLRKLRYETSTIISGTMEKYNIGPVGRLGLELVPSAFLHSKMRKDQHGKSNYTPNQMSEAYDELSQFDE